MPSGQFATLLDDDRRNKQCHSDGNLDDLAFQTAFFMVMLMVMLVMMLMLVSATLVFVMMCHNYLCLCRKNKGKIAFSFSPILMKKRIRNHQ